MCQVLVQSQGRTLFTGVSPAPLPGTRGTAIIGLFSSCKLHTDRDPHPFCLECEHLDLAHKRLLMNIYGMNE